MTVINVSAGGTRTVNQSGTDDVSFTGAGTLDITGMPASPIDVTLSSVGGVGLLDTINITDANVLLAGVAGLSALTTYNIGDGGTLTLSNTAQLSAGSTVNFTSPNGHLVLGNGADVSVLSGLSGYQPGDTIDLPNGAASVSYADNPGANTGGLLTLLDSNGNPITSLKLLTGDYTGQSFGLSPDGNGGTTLSFASNSGTTAPASVQPLYRFFESKSGTQFLTASTSEKDALTNPSSSSYRSDLIEEPNNFGAIDPVANDPNKVQVFRFFDTTYGTHFFTSSLGEAAGLSTPGSSTYRPDLVAEPSATFYEDSAQGTGDLAVYRLFDTVHGTHFYTGSAAEFGGLTTPGSGSYRPDLVNEGVAFYAPSGSFS